jgi:hypothetical protein
VDYLRSKFGTQIPTYKGPINYPGHDGTLFRDEAAPGMDEYGPFKIQEARENQMAKNIQTEMHSRENGVMFVLQIENTIPFGHGAALARHMPRLTSVKLRATLVSSEDSELRSQGS